MRREESVNGSTSRGAAARGALMWPRLKGRCLGSPVSGAAMKGALMWQPAEGRCLRSLVPWVLPGSHEDATG